MVNRRIELYLPSIKICIKRFSATNIPTISQGDVFYYVVGLVLSFLCSIRPLYSTDTYNYYLMFHQINSGQNDVAVEPVYKVISVICKKILGDELGFRLLLFVYASIAMLVIIKAIKSSCDRGMSFIIWFSFVYAFQMMIQTRSAVANAFFLWSLVDIKEKKIKNHYIKICFAYLFHQQAIIYFLVYPIVRFALKYKKILYIATPVVIIISYTIKNHIGIVFNFASKIDSTIAHKIEAYQELSLYREAVINPFNRISLVVFAIIIFELLFVGMKNISEEEIVYLSVLELSIMTYFIGFFAVPVVGMRYPECFNMALIFLLPIIGKKHIKDYLSYSLVVIIYLIFINHQYNTLDIILSYTIGV